METGINGSARLDLTGAAVAITTSTASTAEDATVRIRAHHGVVKRLGAWTTARRFDVRASQGLVVLDGRLLAVTGTGR
jgi:hypothetical protein